MDQDPGVRSWKGLCRTLRLGPSPWAFLWFTDLMPENVVEEKTKAMDLHAVLAEMPQPHGPPMQWR